MQNIWHLKKKLSDQAFFFPHFAFWGSTILKYLFLNEIWWYILWDPPTAVSKIKYNAGPHTSTLSLSVCLFSFLFWDCFLFLSPCICFFFFHFIYFIFLLSLPGSLSVVITDRTKPSVNWCTTPLWNNTLITMMKQHRFGQTFWMLVQSTIPNYLSCYWPITRSLPTLSWAHLPFIRLT